MDPRGGHVKMSSVSVLYYQVILLTAIAFELAEAHESAYAVLDVNHIVALLEFYERIDGPGVPDALSLTPFCIAAKHLTVRYYDHPEVVEAKAPGKPTDDSLDFVQ